MLHSPRLEGEWSSRNAFSGIIAVAQLVSVERFVLVYACLQMFVQLLALVVLARHAEKFLSSPPVLVAAQLRFTGTGQEHIKIPKQEDLLGYNLLLFLVLSLMLPYDTAEFCPSFIFGSIPK